MKLCLFAAVARFSLVFSYEVVLHLWIRCEDDVGTECDNFIIMNAEVQNSSCVLNAGCTK